MSTFTHWSRLAGLNRRQMVYPTHRYWIASFRKMRHVQSHQSSVDPKGHRPKKITSQGNEDLLHEVGKIRWVVHSTRATTQTDVLKSYLARYINRIAISNNRLKYLAQTDEVAILYNDYRNQQNECAAPKAIKHLDPLTAIHQIIQHVLPRHFQKSRHYGAPHLHADTESGRRSDQGTSITVRTALADHHGTAETRTVSMRLLPGPVVHQDRISTGPDLSGSIPGPWNRTSTTDILAQTGSSKERIVRLPPILLCLMARKNSHIDKEIDQPFRPNHTAKLRTAINRANTLSLV